MINKQVQDMAAALDGLDDGAVILAGGFGDAGVPNDLLHALSGLHLKNLTLVGNGAISERIGHGKLIDSGAVSTYIASFPCAPHAKLFDPGTPTADVALEIVPQGTLAERIRAAGAGIPGFFTKTSAGTPLGEGKETREFSGALHVFETAIKADIALIKAKRADRWGNLVYAKACRNFNPIMAMAAKTTIVQVEEIVELGGIDPELVVTPGIFVDRIVVIETPFTAQDLS
ncbi:MAG: 3-oxoacid CoA-transferase subunit A [Proteobacteria bacterium]|nr:3-oxoacid CoA-transferase subunit A [Pseudomonadota bacterium]